MPVDKPFENNPLHIKIEQITADIEWCFCSERTCVGEKARYIELIKNNYKYDPVLHGFGAKNKSQSKSN